jgi:hypothetical protein
MKPLRDAPTTELYNPTPESVKPSAPTQSVAEPGAVSQLKAVQQVGLGSFKRVLVAGATGRVGRCDMPPVPLLLLPV